jgi:hypothetical protein
MLDLLHLPEPDERTVWFPGQGVSTNTTGWRVWTKPRGVSMVSIIAIGSGGGGGGGASAASGSTATGAAPGAGAPMAKMLWPAWALPDKLYVLSVSGGAGGAAGVGGSNGGASRVAIYPNTTAGNLIITTNSGGRGGLASGTSQVALAGATATDAPLGQMAATQLFVTGTATGAGSTGTTSSVTPVIVCPGGGGGGKTTGAGGAGAGYSAVASTLLNTVPGGTAETGADASSGFIHAGIHYGGCGGGGNNLGTGGRGGNGVAWGAGGGGGGGGLTGGAGGDGGPGLVIIASW